MMSDRRRRWPLMRALGGIGLAAAMAACQGYVAYNPFRADSREVRERVRTIALAPLIAPAHVADRETARAQLESLASARLQTGGYTVVASDVMERIWKRAADDVGGIYDPVSGKSDSTRYDTVRAAVYRELGTEHGVDAVLYLAIGTVPIFLPGHRLTYCGTTTSEPVYWPPTAVDLTKHTVTMAVVLCLNSVLVDLEDRELYAIRYGLEPIETYMAQTRAVRPIEHRLRHPSRLTEAINETLGPLANAGQEAAPPTPSLSGDEFRRSLGRPDSDRP